MWKYIEKYKVVLEILVLAPIPTSLILGLIYWIRFGLLSTVPVWILLIGVLSAIVIGFAWGRGYYWAFIKEYLIEREYCETIWRIEQRRGRYYGPYCKYCDVKMAFENNARRIPREPEIKYFYVCRNPTCDRVGNVMAMHIHNDEIYVNNRIKELYEAELRKKKK